MQWLEGQAVLEHFTKIDKGQHEGKFKCNYCNRRLNENVSGLRMHCLKHGINFVNSEQQNTEINEQNSLEEMYNELFGPNHNDDVVPASQGYGHHAQYLTDAEYEHEHKRPLKNLFVKCLGVGEVQ
ncbi:unnamed protein product [Meloidogyne enterolobii]|uniref:Uncharacterized protein n=1 Tax=Meloidogyne enterolobii TaxID=390850 RepID=A0ACB1A0S7_MELEN